VEELEFHWLVGVLEGEGTFLRGAPSKPGTPILRVSMTDRDVVERVAKLFGRAVLRLRRRKPHHKLPYATTIKGAPAAQVMSAVRPHLSKTRQLQIDSAILSWQTRSGPRRGRGADRSDCLSLLVPVADASGTRQARGESQEACDRAFIRLVETDERYARMQVGLIALGRNGDTGASSTRPPTNALTYALATYDGNGCHAQVFEANIPLPAA